MNLISADRFEELRSMVNIDDKAFPWPSGMKPMEVTKLPRYLSDFMRGRQRFQIQQSIDLDNSLALLNDKRELVLERRLMFTAQRGSLPNLKASTNVHKRKASS
jgi:hypothetical protein